MDKEEKARLSKFAIKSSVKTSITDCLEAMPLTMLKEAAYQYGLRGLSKAQKPALVTMLRNAVIDNFPENYIYFTECQEEGFNEIIKNGVLEDVNIFYGKFSLLYELSIAFYFNSNNKLYLSIPNEIVEAYHQLNMNELKAIKIKNIELNKYIVALCNLYGIFEAKQFVEVYNAYHDDKITLTEFEDFAELMEPRQVFFSVFYDDEKNCLICSGEDEDGEFFDIYTENKDRPYYMPAKGEIEQLEDGVYERTVQYENLKEYFAQSKSVSGVQLENLLDDILFHCQKDAEMQEVFGILEHFGVKLNNIKEANKVLKMIADLSNHTRKWVLKGYSPVMLRELSEAPIEAPFPQTGRNEPCPCGSGKKYKKCCGSLLQ